MKKTFLTAFMAAITLLVPFATSASNSEPCDTTCNKPLAVKAYDKVKNGTVNAYDQVKDGTVNAYDQVKDGTVNAYDQVKGDAVKTYDKTKKGLKKGANTIKEEWNKIF